jgi:hypothetical protein
MPQSIFDDKMKTAETKTDTGLRPMDYWWL